MPPASDLTVITTAPPIPAPAASDSVARILEGRVLPGDRIGHFELVEYVGGGGMGRVFRALDTQLGRTVALKVLPPEQAGVADTLQRFQNEAQSTARLDHENIARVYFVGKDGELSYIVFEFVEGTNVRLLVEQKGPLLLAEALSYTIQVNEALAHADGRGGPSRHQTVERVDHAGRASEVDRHGLGTVAQRRSVRRRLDAKRRHAGDLRLYFAGAGARSPRRRHPQRHLLARLHVVFHAQRAAAVSGGDGVAETAPASGGRAAGREDASSRRAGGTEPRDAEDDGQRPAAAVREFGGVSRGSARAGRADRSASDESGQQDLVDAARAIVAVFPAAFAVDGAGGGVALRGVVGRSLFGARDDRRRR